MKRESLSYFTKAAVIALGAACLAAAVIRLPAGVFTAGFLFILVFSVLVAPRMTLTMPRSKFAISFSDSLIFLSFLLYGGEAAIILAAAETCANCFYLKRSGFHWGPLMIPTNIAINTVSTSATFVVWFWLYQLGALELSPYKTQHLIALLGILAFTQFLVSSYLAAVFHSMKDGNGLWETWRKYCFSGSRPRARMSSDLCGPR